MPDTTRIEKWINQTDIDYYTCFIKAWIPFNAWYRENFSDMDSDRACINATKRTGNRFRDVVIQLLENDNNEALYFKSSLGSLNDFLSSNPIKSKQKYNKDYKITFSNIILEPYKYPPITYKHNRIEYFLRIDRNSGEVIIKVKGIKEIVIQLSVYTLDELLNNSNYKKLSITQKNIVKDVFVNQNPSKGDNVLFIDSRDIDSEKIKCGNVYFSSNKEFIAKAIIECLYLLRNSLFHGELTPTSKTLEVYKYAYELLHIIINKLYV